MDDHRFDQMTRALAGGISRRTILRALSGGAAGGLLGSGVLAAAACREIGRLCVSDGNCCSGFCDLTNPDPSKRRRCACAGGQPGDACAVNGDCCNGSCTCGTAEAGHCQAPFAQGFETDVSGWSGSALRVAAGTHGIASRTGGFHAEIAQNGGDFTRWGGYGGAFPAGGYTTRAAIYLDVNVGAANDTRFDFSSAINTPGCAHRRDYVFNAGFYTGPNRWVVSASNNAGRANSFPQNPARNPITIAATGWYVFQHAFYDAGAGRLAANLTIIDPSGSVVGAWTLPTPSDFSDVIGTTVGGNRYGWFVNQEFPFLAVDDSSRS